MGYIQCTADERAFGYCVFCGRELTTRDHCPSIILLDEPYPDDLPVVPACLKCNSSFSLDEEYLACLVACVLAGTTDPEKIQREKIKLILQRKQALRTRLEQSVTMECGNVTFSIEADRVGAVITKLARGHAFYELHEHCLDEPAIIQCLPLDRMMPHEKQTFENPPAPTLCPEIGSRAMHRMLIVDNGSQIFHDWITIQNGMYRYHASLSNNIHIRIVIQDYLACDVIWE